MAPFYWLAGRYSHEIEELRLMLQAQRDKSGTYMPTERYEQMMKDMESTKQQLKECEGALSCLREDLGAEKSRAEGLEGDLADSRDECAKVSEDSLGGRGRRAGPDPPASPSLCCPR